MKLWTAAAFATAFFSSPAEAATVVYVEASASGSTQSLLCMTGPQCLVTDPFAAAFSREVTLDAFVNGIATFQSGPNSNAGTISGTVRDLGGGMMAGFNFRFDQTRYCSRTPCLNMSTSLTASTFSVRQIFPSAVPEPGTWATMLLGFGAIGASLRRARRTRQRTALAA